MESLASRFDSRIGFALKWTDVAVPLALVVSTGVRWSDTLPRASSEEAARRTPSR